MCIRDRHHRQIQAQWHEFSPANHYPWGRKRTQAVPESDEENQQDSEGHSKSGRTAAVIVNVLYASQLGHHCTWQGRTVGSHKRRPRARFGNDHTNLPRLDKVKRSGQSKPYDFGGALTQTTVSKNVRLLIWDGYSAAKVVKIIKHQVFWQIYLRLFFMKRQRIKQFVDGTFFMKTL